MLDVEFCTFRGHVFSPGLVFSGLELRKVARVFRDQ